MIAEKFGLGHIKDVPMALSTLYQQYLLRFEDFLLKTLGAGAPVPAGRTQPVQMPAREYAQPQYMQVRSTTGGPSLVGLQARVYGGDQDPRQDAHFTQTSRFYSTSRPDTLSHELGNSAPQNQQLCSEFPYSHSQTGRPPVSPAVTLEPPQNMRGMQYPTSQGVYPVHPHAQQPKYYVPQGQATHFQQLRKENSPKSPLATDGTYQKPHPPQPLVQHLVNTRRKTTTTPEFSRSAYAPEGKHVPPGEVSAAPGAGAPASKAAKNDYFIFRPRIYRLDTYGGLDISAIAGVPPAPHISGRAYEGPIDIERVVMSIKSKLDPEIKYALDSLFTLSMDESLEFGLDQFPELFDLLVLIAEGRLFSPKSHNASEISQEFYGIPEEPCQDEGNAGLSEMLTANVIVCGGDSEKEIKKSAAHAGVRKNSSSMQFILLSYSLLLQHENMRSGGVQDIRDDVYEVMCSENRKLTVISAETILRNFSFISLNQRFLGRNKRFRRLLMSMLTAGSLVRNRDNSVSLNRSPGDYHVDNPDPLPKNGCASEIGDKGEAGPCHHSADESLDILVTPEDEEGSLIPETVILSKNRNLLNHPSLSAHIALERRINGLTILSNIGFHYHMRSEVEAYIIWSVIFDFLIGNDLVHSYTALEALTRLTLIYDNAKYFSKLKRMNIIIDRVVSMLPSEPFLSFGVAQLPRSMEMANSTTIRQRSAGSQGVTPDHYTDLKNYPANNIQTSKKGNDSHSKRGEDSDTQDQRDITRIRTFFQPILNKFTQEEISLWEMASMALLHIVLIDEASVKETLASTPRFIQKLMDLINAPLILSLHNISPSLMPTALSLCIRSLRMLLECLKDGTICSLAQVHEQTMLHILWSLRSISEYNLSYGNDAGLQQPHDCALQYESDCSSPFKHMETLVSECLNLLGHLE